MCFAREPKSPPLATQITTSALKSKSAADLPIDIGPPLVYVTPTRPPPTDYLYPGKFSAESRGRNGEREDRIMEFFREWRTRANDGTVMNRKYLREYTPAVLLFRSAALRAGFRICRVDEEMIRRRGFFFYGF